MTLFDLARIRAGSGGLLRRSLTVVMLGLPCAGQAQGLDELLGLPADDERPAVFGYGEFALARTLASPEHWSKIRGRLEVGTSGSLDGVGRWKLSARGDVDAAHQIEGDVYPSRVRDDQRTDFAIREAYIDSSSGDWEYRLGRQQIVWGEMVGSFFADVVSARDLREFFLPELETMRIPQWAARAEYFGTGYHAELVWIPVATVDDIGEPGGEFYPFALPDGATIQPEAKPSARPANMNWGARMSALNDGWDTSLFYYRSVDINATLYPLGGLDFEPRHDRIRQIGVTVGKDVSDTLVFKTEVVHTHGRRFLSVEDDPLSPFATQSSGTLDYAFGLDYSQSDTRINIQLSARTILDHDDRMGGERNEPVFGILANHKLSDRLEMELQYVAGLNRWEYMLRPKVVWRPELNWRIQVGGDVFEGPADGIFGRFDDRDRLTAEVRRDF
ncbi:MAG: hypothetical protein KDH15_05170 [Rhodocyclaceae bacterium]|nr:hypothetical protein [Rhodocyclaceae bacterium]